MATANFTSINLIFVGIEICRGVISCHRIISLWRATNTIELRNWSQQHLDTSVKIKFIDMNSVIADSN